MLLAYLLKQSAGLPSLQPGKRLLVTATGNGPVALTAAALARYFSVAFAAWHAYMSVQALFGRCWLLSVLCNLLG